MPVSMTKQLNVSVGGDPEKVKKSERDRFRDDKIVDEIIELDNSWRKSMPYLIATDTFCRAIRMRQPQKGTRHSL